MATSKESANGELWTSLLLLRLLVLVFSLLALVLMLLDREDGNFPLQVFGLPQPVLVKARAQYKLIDGLKFYVVAMGVISAYNLLQIAISLACRRISGNKKINWIIFIGDMSMAYLNASASAVALQIAYLAERGAPKVMWNKLCDSFGHYCRIYGVSMVSSLLSSLAALLVACVSAFHLFRIYGRQSARQI